MKIIYLCVVIKSLTLKLLKMQKQTLTISQADALTLFLNVDKSKEVNLLYQCKVDMNKEKTNIGTKELNIYHNLIEKIVSINVKLSNYHKRVIVNGEKEGIDMSNWQTDKPSGKHHISYCVLAKDTDTNVKYLGYECVQGFAKPKTEYIFQNQPIDKVIFAKWLKDSSKSQKQPQQNEVIWRTLGFDNIKEFTLDSVRYVIQ